MGVQDLKEAEAPSPLRMPLNKKAAHVTMDILKGQYNLL